MTKELEGLEPFKNLPPLRYKDMEFIYRAETPIMKYFRASLLKSGREKLIIILSNIREDSKSKFKDNNFNSMYPINIAREREGRSQK